MRMLSLNMPWIILGSALLAHLLPFELVLFSYAFLGPAHYLTEISWLHDRKYFSGVNWFASITALAIALNFAFPTHKHVFFWIAMLTATLSINFANIYVRSVLAAAVILIY